MSPFLFRRTLFVASALAVCSLACSPQGEESELYERVLDGNVFDTAPVRGEFRPLRYRRTGFEYKCTECHTDLGKPPRRNQAQTEHAAIQARFDHGLNTDCLNCHHESRRNFYTNHDGSPIPSDNPARLCANCHGPTYREWQVGVHGRQNGYWDTNKGKRTKLVCVQCHDPHHPAFPLMTPDPPPIRSRLALQPQDH